MSRSLSVTEPHPSVPTSGAYLYGGRGGAGNFKRYKGNEVTQGPSATGPASRISLTKPFKRQSAQPTGRGGAGNMFKAPEAEERVFQFDEEMVKRRELQAPVYHIGRGGAANFVDERQQDLSRTERVNSSDSDSSASSDGSLRSNARRLEDTFSKLSRKFS